MTKASNLIVFCVQAVLTAAMLSAQAPPSKVPPADSLTRALQLARAHQYSEAEAAIRGVAPPADRQQRIAYFRLKAAIASGLGRTSDAAGYLETARKLAPENLDLQIASGLARLQAQLENRIDPGATLKSLRSTPLPPEGELELRLRLAELLSSSGRFEEAATDLAVASRRAPDRSDILFNLALAQFRVGQLDAALASAERAKQLQNSGSLESLVGDIQEQRGDSLAAVHSYQAAVALEPSEERHRLALAIELLRHQTFDAAIVVLDQSAQLFPQSVRVRILQGLAYYLVDRSPEAIRALLEATRLGPNDETATRYLGEISLQDSASPDPAAAVQLCKFADEHPKNKTAGAFCGGVLLRLARENEDVSRKPEILLRLRRAVLEAPAEPVARCQAAKAFEWAEQWQRARIQMEECVRLDPDSPEGHYRLSRIYRQLGLADLAGQQTLLQQQAAQRQSDESLRRTKTVTKFLVLLDR
jgi:tetratricopeptide (TPR) repeat protein